MRTFSLILALLLTVALNACGYKTPLSLPKPAPDTAASKPAPSPETTNAGSK